jgi:hypothetical protein
MNRWLDNAQCPFYYASWDDFHKYAPYNQSFWINWHPLSFSERKTESGHFIQFHYVENTTNPYDYIRVVQIPIKPHELPLIREWFKNELLKNL